MRKMKKLNPPTIDWTKSDKELAEQHGVSIGSINYHRHKLGERSSRRTEYYIDWTNADWRKPNFLLALEYCVTPGPVCKARTKYAPEHLKKSPKGFPRFVTRRAKTKPDSKPDVNPYANIAYANIVLPTEASPMPTIDTLGHTEWCSRNATPKPTSVGWFRRLLSSVFNFNVTVEGSK